MTSNDNSIIQLFIKYIMSFFFLSNVFEFPVAYFIIAPLPPVIGENSHFSNNYGAHSY